VTHAELNPLGCAIFLIGAFAVAGCAQAVWLAWPISQRYAWPLDGGLTWRGRRLLGDNKTIRGFLVMLPATGFAFMVLSTLTMSRGAGLWHLTPIGYTALGVLAGAGFMLGELPNSFVKRQLDIPPGAAAEGRLARPVFFAVDRIDSAVGVLAALMLVVPVPPATIAYVLVVGSVVHGLFSVLTFRLGGKARPA